MTRARGETADLPQSSRGNALRDLAVISWKQWDVNADDDFYKLLHLFEDRCILLNATEEEKVRGSRLILRGSARMLIQKC
mmetsp:Transcript_10001/g.14445  ORF Transcript_10001/g.14445 Transcript_10001/m.14445 type:complete len:80 (+) Transcript_10001:134-373(+)